MKPISSLNSRSILIVEDEFELREALVYEFKRRGCNVVSAANGVEAFELLLENPVDIVLSDVRMPEGDGVHLLKNIKTKYPNVPIVLLATGFADLTEAEALSMGAYALLEKPINRKQMISILEAYCDELLKKIEASTRIV